MHCCRFDEFVLSKDESMEREHFLAAMIESVAPNPNSHVRQGNKNSMLTPSVTKSGLFWALRILRAQVLLP